MPGPPIDGGSELREITSRDVKTTTMDISGSSIKVQVVPRPEQAGQLDQIATTESSYL
jgi:hypothetical protein